MKAILNMRSKLRQGKEITKRNRNKRSFRHRIILESPETKRSK